MTELEKDLRTIERLAHRHETGPFAPHFRAILSQTNLAIIDVMEGSDEDGLPAHKRKDYSELMYEAADMERKRIREEGR